MNEKEIERLMTSYSDSLGPRSSRQPVRREQRWGRRVTLTVAALTVVFTTTIAIWPRNGIASTLARVRQQIIDARTVEEHTYMRLPRRWYDALDIYYANNMWSIEKGAGTHVDRTTIFRDGQMFVSYRDLDFATVSKTPPDSFGWTRKDGQSVLDFVKNGFGVGPNGDPKDSVVIKDHAPIDGKPIYVISVDQPNAKRQIDIFVDKKTDRPVQSEMHATDRWNKPLIYRSDIRVNGSIDPRVFTVDTSKKIVHVPEDAASLSSQWAKPLASVEETDVRNVSVMRNGTVWVAVTLPKGQKEWALPTQIRDDQDNAYVRIQDLDPAEATPGQDLQLFGKDIQVTGFVRLESQGRLPHRITIGFAKREQLPPNFNPDMLRQPGALLPAQVTVAASVNESKWPDYFERLGLDYYIGGIESCEWQARAKGLEKAGRLLEAARAYGRYAEAQYRIVKYSAFEPMLDEARLYRRLGDTKRADDLAKRAETLKESRER